MPADVRRTKLTPGPKPRGPSRTLELGGVGDGAVDEGHRLVGVDLVDLANVAAVTVGEGVEEGRTGRCLFQLDVGVVVGDRARDRLNGGESGRAGGEEMRAAEMMVFMVVFLV